MGPVDTPNHRSTLKYNNNNQGKGGIRAKEYVTFILTNGSLSSDLLMAFLLALSIRLLT